MGIGPDQEPQVFRTHDAPPMLGVALIGKVAANDLLDDLPFFELVRSGRGRGLKGGAEDEDATEPGDKPMTSA